MNEYASGFGKAFAVVLVTVSMGLAASSCEWFESKPKPTFGPCQYEDGNPDGKPCVWTDPDTGVQHLVDSSEYLR